MAWTSPKTFVANDPLSASELNTHLRDNLLETMVGKVTAAGDTAYANASHALSRLPIGLINQVLRVNAAGNAPEWGYPASHFIQKTTATARNTTTTLADDPQLVLSNLPAGHYAFLSYINYASNTTADFKFMYHLSNTGVYTSMGFVIKINLGSGSYSQTVDGTFETTLTADGGALFGLGSVLTIILVTFTDVDSISFQWAQNTSNGSDTTVLDDLSWMCALQLGIFV